MLFLQRRWNDQLCSIARVALSFACLVLVGGCAESTYRQHVLEDIQVRAQERLLHQARMDYEQGQYKRTIQRIDRMLTLYADSPIKTDAHWLLARSYDQLGQPETARQYYQKVLHGPRPGRYGKQARRRLNELNVTSEVVTRRQKDVRAIRLSLSQFVGPEPLEALTGHIKRLGATTLLVDVGCHLFEPSSAEIPVGAWEIKSQALKKKFKAITTRAHRRHLDVVAGIDLRCLGGPDALTNRNWRDRRYDARTRSVRRLKQYDLFNPYYQAFVETFLLHLAGAQVDGVLFLTGDPMHSHDGVTPAAQQAFAKAFGFRLNLPRLFDRVDQSARAHLASETPAQQKPVPQMPEFWRWIGWKSRERLHVMQGLMRRLRMQHPDLVFGLELHSKSIEHPLDALVQDSEDFLEAAQGDFTFLFVQILGNQDPVGYSTHLEDSPGKATSIDLVKQMMVVLKNPRRIWMMDPATRGALGWDGSEKDDRARAGSAFPKGVGVVYDRRSLP